MPVRFLLPSDLYHNVIACLPLVWRRGHLDMLVAVKTKHLRKTRWLVCGELHLKGQKSSVVLSSGGLPIVAVSGMSCVYKNKNKM